MSETGYKTNYTLLWKSETLFNSDCIEWCPEEGHQDLFVCGMYQLESPISDGDEERRIGGITLYRYTEDNIQPLHILSQPGVLDIKWAQHNQLFGAAMANGQLNLYKVIDDRLELLSMHRPTRLDTGLSLSLDWHVDDTNVFLSDSSGCVSNYTFQNDALELLETWRAHDFEVWVVAHDYQSPNIVYSGGDDSYFKGWDLRMEKQPLFRNRSHTMGVTCIRKSPHHDNHLLTGSYDESVRLWDNRTLKQPVTQLNVGGGLWRLKWHPSKPNLFSTACMRAGFKILTLQDQTLTEILHYNDHSSLAYGIDWSYQHSTNILASCSFYDHQVHVWKAEI